MFLSIWRAECLKLRRSPMWLAFFLMPLIPAFFGTVNYFMNLEILKDFWYSLWTQHTLFSCYFFLPLLIGVYCAYLWRLEHSGNNWNLMLTAPISRTMLVLAKTANAALLTAAVIVWTMVLYLASGLICGLDFRLIPWHSLIFWLAGGIAGGITVCAVQMFLALWIRSFAVPAGIALIGGVSGLAMTSWGFPLLDPYALLNLGMQANGRDTGVSPMGFALSCLCFSLLFTVLSVALLKYRETKTG